MATLERLQILVTAEQKRWLDGESRRRGEAITALVREAIEAARTRRTPSQRLAALEHIEQIWAQPSGVVDDLPIEELNRMIDDSRLDEATAGSPE